MLPEYLWIYTFSCHFDEPSKYEDMVRHFLQSINRSVLSTANTETQVRVVSVTRFSFARCHSRFHRRAKYQTLFTLVAPTSTTGIAHYSINAINCILIHNSTTITRYLYRYGIKSWKDHLIASIIFNHPRTIFCQLITCPLISPALFALLFILRRKTNQRRAFLIYNGACYGVENLHPARERYLGRVGTSGCRKEKILSSKSFLPTLWRTLPTLKHLPIKRQCP